MFKDLFVTIAAGVIGILPVTPPPAVVVTTANVEASVVQYIENHEDRNVTIDCDFNVTELSITEKESHEFKCVTTDKENKEIFETKIVLTVHDAKVSITAILDKTDKLDESKSGVIPLPVNPEEN